MDTKILSWDKPKKAISTDLWKKISADGAPPGVYTPNMSQGDQDKWKAKYIGGTNPRVEIRKSFNGTQMLIVVSDHIKVSLNGTALLDLTEWPAFHSAINEAMSYLKEKAIP